jgi:hypothetical protein
MELRIQQNNQPEAMMVLFILVIISQNRAKNYPVIRAKVNWDKESVGKMITRILHQ